MMRLFLSLVGGTVALGAGFGPIAASAADINIKIATTVSDKHNWFKASKVLDEETQKRVPGKVAYEVVFSAQLGPDPVVLAGLQSGTHVMTFQGSSQSSVIPEFNVFEAPFMYGSRAEIRKVIAAIEGDLEKASLKKGIVLTAIGELGWRQISNNVRPIVKPEDLQGIKLRTPDSPFRITMFKHFGANPAPMAIPEVYVALRQGVMDGQENPLSSIASFKFHEVQKYISMVNHVFTPTVILVSKIHWDRWPADIRKAMTEASKAAMEYTFKLGETDDDRLKAELSKHSQFNNADSAAFRAAAKPLHAEIEKKVGKELWAKVEAALK